MTLACCGVFASGGIAAADEPEEGGEAKAADADAAPTPPTEAAATAAPAARWPRSVIARQLTLPKGLLQVGGDLGANNDFSVLGLNLVGGYGITDDLEVTGFYAFALKDFEIKGSLDVDVGYKLLRGAAGGKLEVIGRGRIGYNALGEAANPLRLGAQVQYNLTDKIAVITPGQQISIGLSGDTKEVFFQLPVAVGFQATPELYLQLDTTLAKVKIANSANAFIFADSTPIAVTGTYNAIPALDVIVSIGLNLTPPSIPAVPPAPAVEPGVGDTLTFLVGARYYVGKL